MDSPTNSSSSLNQPSAVGQPPDGTPSPTQPTPQPVVQNTHQENLSSVPTPVIQTPPTQVSPSPSTTPLAEGLPTQITQPPSEADFTITTVGPVEKPAEQAKSAVKNNVPLLLLLFGAIVAAGISGVYFYTASRAQPVTPTLELRPSTSPQVITTPIVIHQPIAQTTNTNPLSKEVVTMTTKTSAWLATMKTSNNVYFHNQYSQAETLTPADLIDNRAGIYVAWGLYTLWVKTQEAALLTQVESILQSHSDTTIVNTLQPDFLSCRLLFDMANNTQLPESIGRLAKNVCERSRFIVPDISKTDALNGSSVITPVPPRNLSAVLNTPVETLINQDQTNELEQKAIQYAAFTSDFVGRAWWFEKTNDVVIATSLFNLAVDAFEKTRATGSSRGTCNLGLASVDMFQLTQEEQYLAFAKNLFTQMSTAQSSLLIDKVSCLMFADNLNLVAPTTDYKQYANTLQTDIIEKQFDQTVGAFYSVFGDTKVYDTKENGLLTGLLTQR